MKKVALYIFAIIIVFIFWFAFSLFHKYEEWWLIFEFEHIGSDVTIATISWLKVVIFGIVSVGIGFVGFKNHKQ
ncbi:hypothetical protein QFZ77_004665 [Paenibacillus sp. V4I3]|uniref:hypothetical protein n=1 Tax=Paenibacillus sp. V4I3 TaxID=3042305 RepID=UPI00277EF9BB|nr:hypothetical protein [Paenibacillus sp. V4I3]MDQ0876006.1 hypothetical protein [Paenibacillus sp. V4I3]